MGASFGNKHWCGKQGTCQCDRNQGEPSGASQEPRCLLAHFCPLWLPSQAVGTQSPVMVPSSSSSSCLPWCHSLSQGLHPGGLFPMLPSLRRPTASYIFPRTILGAAWRSSPSPSALWTSTSGPTGAAVLWSQVPLAPSLLVGIGMRHWSPGQMLPFPLHWGPIAEEMPPSMLGAWRGRGGSGSKGWYKLEMDELLYWL